MEELFDYSWLGQGPNKISVALDEVIKWSVYKMKREKDYNKPKWNPTEHCQCWMYYECVCPSLPVSILMGLFMSWRRRETQGWMPPPKIGRSVPMSICRSSKFHTTLRVKAWLVVWGNCSSRLGSGIPSLTTADGWNTHMHDKWSTVCVKIIDPNLKKCKIKLKF